ncbi:helix-hairpin-helix domain-containing protein [Alteromonadaceae bacterium M269]|nr:helix-hairpin-helix domain-containing protein [Alteromonadaceae bacterium M269]
MKKFISTLLLATSLGLAFLPAAYSANESAVSQTQLSQSNLININTATAEQLQQLPGIGKKKAQAIVDYRNENGRFLSVDELINVKGIGKKMVSKLDGKVGVG